MMKKSGIKDSEHTPTFYEAVIIDGIAKSPDSPFFVIPAKAGIQSFQILLDSRFHGSDMIFDFLRSRHY
jgi:hypothetical protein